MISVSQAIKIITDSVPVNAVEQVSLKDMSNGVLASDVVANINMPPFRQSAMDGYALCIHDKEVYTLIGEVKAGDNHEPVLEKGQAIRIFTGAPVPKTANAVVMQEKVVATNNIITLQNSVTKNANIRPVGEQITKGKIALKKGTKLTPAAVGYLSSLGVTTVSVYKKPKVAIAVTGNELVVPGNSLLHGQIYESNAIMLKTALSSVIQCSCTVNTIADVYENTKDTIESLLKTNDIVLLTGGISVGDYDFVGKALKALAVEEQFYKIKQKPGKPLFFGKKDNTYVFALPGNPAAALTCFYIYVYPLLQLIMGNKNCHLPTTKEKSATDFIKKGDRAQFLKAHFKNGKVNILEGQSSAMLQTYAIANAFVYVPEHQSNIAINDFVNVIHLPIS